VHHSLTSVGLLDNIRPKAHKSLADGGEAFAWFFRDVDPERLRVCILVNSPPLDTPHLIS
jgi:hypothetical protein